MQHHRVLVTGATGSVGRPLVHALVARGLQVRAFSRNCAGSQVSRFPDHVECVAGDIRDPQKVRQALGGCTAVIHLAAATGISESSPAASYEVNVNGTRNLLKACTDSDVRRLCHVSTLATLESDDGAGAADSDWRESPYVRSKRLGEALAVSAATAGFDVIIVNPGWVYGPAAGRASSLNRFLAFAARWPILPSPPGGSSISFVDDVVSGLVNALSLGLGGRRYALTSSRIALADLARMARAQLGRRAALVPIPDFVWRAGGRVADRVGSFAGRRLPISSLSVGMMTARHYVSSDLAQRELGYAPTPVDQAVGTTVRWLRQGSGGRATPGIAGTGG